MHNKLVFIIMLVFATGLVGCQKSPVGMTLDPEESLISFTSIKKGKVGEVHTFTDISGSFASDGLLKVDIQLASLETNIPIRNERMLELLFEVGKFATAELTASVNANFPEGEVKNLMVDAHLNLHGSTVALKIDARVARVGDKLLVSSVKPVILNVADFGLDEGIEKLMEAATLPSIARAIPVSFNLIFAP